MVSNDSSNPIAAMGTIAGIGLLVVGTTSWIVGLSYLMSNPLSVIGAAACFAVATASFGVVFLAVIRK